MTSTKITLWLSLGFVFYTYFGYPFLLLLQSVFFKKKVTTKQIVTSVSVVMSVLNEEMRIAARIDNILAQQYPPELFEIIVVSDGSNDRTCNIVRSYAEKNVRLIELPQRVGKASALNRAVDAAQGEIIVFADARQRFESDVISSLVANFYDSVVGCVSGELLFEYGDSAIQGEMGAYWKYEKWLRKKESNTGSVIGATGAIYAIRKNLYSPLPQGTLLDDVLTPMNIVLQGYRCIFDGSAVAYDVVSKDAAVEWGRKVRTLAGNWQLLSLKPSLIIPMLNPLWWRFISHKIFRLIVPFALIVLLISGALLDGIFYRALTAVQTALYGVFLIGLVLPSSRGMRAVNITYFFLVMNLAALAGFWIWLTGRCNTAWSGYYNVKKAAR